LLLEVGDEGEERTVDEGGTYTWSNALTYWIRKEAYDLADADLALLQQIDGTVTPSAEVPAWGESTANGGSISVVGGRVLFDTSTTNNESAYATRAPGVNGESYLMQAELEITDHACTVDGLPAHYFRVIDTVKYLFLNIIRHVEAESRICDLANTVIGVVVGSGPDVTAAPTLIEIIISAGNWARAYHGAGASYWQNVPWASLPNNAADSCRIGDGTTTLNTGQQKLYVRNLKVIRLT
jgi:hypothetical protein